VTATKANAASIPRSERVLGRAECLATDSVGDVVRIRAAKSANVFKVEKADISVLAKMPAVGVIFRKDSATDAWVQFHGPLRGVFSGLTPNARYFVGTDGTIAEDGDGNYPTYLDSFQQIGVATSDDELLIHPQGVSDGEGTKERWDVTLLGLTNGSNRTFMTPEKFAHLQGSRTIRVYHNGRRLRQSSTASPLFGEYHVSESGGVGTGFDTIVFLTFTPNTLSVLSADYYVANS